MRLPSESGARIKVSGGRTSGPGPTSSGSAQLFQDANENRPVHNVLYAASIPRTVIRAETRCTSCGAVLRDLKEQPVAFGLKAILAIAVVGDAEGGSDRLEQSLAALPGVGSVETVDVTLV